MFHFLARLWVQGEINKSSASPRNNKHNSDFEAQLHSMESFINVLQILNHCSHYFPGIRFYLQIRRKVARKTRMNCDQTRGSSSLCHKSLSLTKDIVKMFDHDERSGCQTSSSASWPAHLRSQHNCPRFPHLPYLTLQKVMITIIWISVHIHEDLILDIYASKYELCLLHVKKILDNTGCSFLWNSMDSWLDNKHICTSLRKGLKDIYISRHFLIDCLQVMVS